MRHLRDGALPEALACATICILDDLQTCGGLEVLQQVRVLLAGPGLPGVAQVPIPRTRGCSSRSS